MLIFFGAMSLSFRAFVGSVLARSNSALGESTAGAMFARSGVAALTLSIEAICMTSVFAPSRQAVPVMRRQGSGAIVNVTSLAARTGGGGGSVVYATAKAAVSTFTRGLARELAPEGIRVNAVAPGIITTPFHERHTSDALMKSMVGAVPMQRPGRPDECVGAVLFLASAAMSSYITGQIVEINGGQLTP